MISFEIKPVFFDQINHGKTRCLILIHFASQKTSSNAFRNTEVTCSPEKNSQLPQDSEGEEEEDLSPTHQVVEDVKAVESRGATPKQQVLFW